MVRTRVPSGRWMSTTALPPPVVMTATSLPSGEGRTCECGGGCTSRYRSPSSTQSPTLRTRHPPGRVTLPFSVSVVGGGGGPTEGVGDGGPVTGDWCRPDGPGTTRNVVVDHLAHVRFGFVGEPVPARVRLGEGRLH